MNDLVTIQSWMQTALISRGDLNEKLTIANKKTGLDIDEIIASNKGVSANERFDIYASGYVLRLLECMKADFPKLEQFLGKELFDTFAKAYIVTIPSSSWNLYDLGAKFSNFLKESEPKDENPLFKLPALITQIERMYAKALQEEGIEGNIQKRKNSFFDIFAQDITLKQVPCLGITKQPYDLYEFFLNIKPLTNCEIPIQKESYLAVYRKNYRVNITKLQKWQYYFLQACEKEISLNEAIEICANKIEESPSSLRAKLVFWLPLAFDMAFLKII